MTLPTSSPGHADAEHIVRDAVDAGRLEPTEARRLVAGLRDDRVREVVCEGAAESKRRGKGDVVSVSRNVFIPLTNLCRDRCSYCTFAKTPDDPAAKSWELAEVAEAVRAGLGAGCTEALFCLGDKPEVAYRTHRAWLQARGWKSTADHLVEACRVGVEGGLFPHTNAGILSAEQMARLRPWNASMGLMLETTSRRLRGRGMAHFWAPDKEPELRLRMHREAGELGIPFTSGMLLGIGENDAERLDTLLAIRGLADRYGHVQEVIVQPFHPKPDTRMAGEASPDDHDVVVWVAMARLVLGPQMNVQAPPNLASDLLERLLHAGVNDWGGVSPLTIDYINPESPWPALVELRRRTEAAGQRLCERLPVYPEHLRRPELFDPDMLRRLLARADAEGWARSRQLGEEEAA